MLIVPLVKSKPIVSQVDGIQLGRIRTVMTVVPIPNQHPVILHVLIVMPIRSQQQVLPRVPTVLLVKPQHQVVRVVTVMLVKRQQQEVHVETVPLVLTHQQVMPLVPVVVRLHIPQQVLARVHPTHHVVLNQQIALPDCQEHLLHKLVHVTHVTVVHMRLTVPPIVRHGLPPVILVNTNR